MQRLPLHTNTSYSYTGLVLVALHGAASIYLKSQFQTGSIDRIKNRAYSYYGELPGYDAIHILYLMLFIDVSSGTHVTNKLWCFVHAPNSQL